MLNSSKTLKKSIAKRLKTLRERLNLTQKNLSQRLGMTITSISTIEVGNQLPTIPLIIKLYDDLRISPLWLLKGEGEMFLKDKESPRYSPASLSL